MIALAALATVLVLGALAALAGVVSPLAPVVGVAVPYAAAALFIVGLSARVLRWASAPVPFRIPTTCGQQRSLSWIRPARLDNPSSALGAAGRVALEVLLFRSLFRNTRAELAGGPRLVYGEDKALWLGALVFHWSLLVVGLRHLRFVLEPVPALVAMLAHADGFFEIGTPALYLTNVTVVAGLGYLLWRRLGHVHVRYVSLFEDYLALCLLGGIVATGIAMRYLVRVDTAAAKEFALGLVTFAPTVPDGLGALFFAHVGLVSALAAYFPWSKLVHMAGVFLSPTRNLANTSRRRRHVNPWDAPVPVHSYAEWEDEVRDELVIAGLPVEKE
jgi:nitrate reductase gamma subunit